MKRGVLILILILVLSSSIISLAGSVIAADVAYILKNPRLVDNNILNEFSEMNLTVGLIKDSNVRTTNFSKYRFIFVGDETFRNRNYIPIDKVNSVIMNRNYGVLWGLTDDDGIAQLAATSPLSVVYQSNILQVYTQAKDGSLSIPYYYLPNENKASGLRKVAGTYTGNSFDLGDVVSVAPAGMRLTNDKTSKGKICFYGIAKTRFWTENARNLFKECVGYVLTACSSDADCNDDNRYTQDRCENPSTIDARCVHEPIRCFDKNDCGQDSFVGNVYCDGVSGKDVYRNFTSFTCNSPGTTSSFCTNSTQALSNMTCEFGCSQGQCIACDENSDCGQNGFVGLPFCDGTSGNDIFRNFNSFTCNSPGTLQAFCSDSILPTFLEACSQACIGGECKTITCYNNSDCNDGNIRTEDICVNPATINSFCQHNNITCFNNLECGTNFLSGNLCSGNNVVRNFLNFTCNNAGTPSSFCTNISGSYSIEACSQRCAQGTCIVINCTQDSDCLDIDDRTIDRCINPNTTASYCRHTEVNCLNDNDCGFTGFLGGNFCSNNDVFKYHQNSTCLNPGTLESSCNIVVSPRLIDECDDGNTRTIDFCVENPPPVRCENRIIECFNNSECQGGGLVNNFCKGDEVWSNVSLPLCLNPGQISSSCSLSYTQIFNASCEFGCSNGSCLPGVHDIAIIENSEFIKGIRIKDNNSSETLLNDTPLLYCNGNYEVKFRTLNVGNFIENLTFNSELTQDSTILDTWNPGNKLNLFPGDSTDRSTSTQFDFASLSEGFYNITVHSNIVGFLDENLLDNTKTRQIEILCHECFVDEDCGEEELINNYCNGSEVWSNYSVPACLDGECGVDYEQVLNETCEFGCSNGECQEQPLCNFTLIKFYNNAASNLVTFPEGGGTDDSTKIKLPLNSSIIQAKLNLTGLPVEISGEKKLDIVLVNDVSYSMSLNNKLKMLKQAAKKFVNISLTPIDNRDGLVSYSTKVKDFTALTNNKALLISEINSYTANSWTCISCGINKGIEIVNVGSNPEKVMLLMSDGRANRCLSGFCGHEEARQEAIDKASEAWNTYGIHVYAISFSDKIDEQEEMRQIAIAGNGSFYIVDTTNIEDVYEDIAINLTQSYPTNPSLDIGENSIIDWSHAGEFSTTETITFNSILQNFLSTCSCPGCSLASGNCTLDFKLDSDTAGKILANSLFIRYQSGC